MTHTTPEQAKEIADMLEANRTSINQSLSINALRSLADQLEAVTAERDAYKLDAERYRFWRGRYPVTFAPTDMTPADVDRCTDAAVAKEAK